MTFDEYQRLAYRTIKHHMAQENMLTEALMGLNGEAGEAIDILKKSMFHGHKLDEVHLAKELGDCCWYIAEAATALNIDLETIFQINIDKLRERYPQGFGDECSINRKAGDI